MQAGGGIKACGVVGGVVVMVVVVVVMELFVVFAGVGRSRHEVWRWGYMLLNSSLSLSLFLCGFCLSGKKLSLRFLSLWKAGRAHTQTISAAHDLFTQDKTPILQLLSYVCVCIVPCVA